MNIQLLTTPYNSLQLLTTTDRYKICGFFFNKEIKPFLLNKT